jgi:hypothetical protein
MAQEPTDEQILKEKVSQYNPQLQVLKKIDLLVELNNDALSDLEDLQVTAVALFRALDEHYVQLPGTMAFMNGYVSLVRSRGRLGRQEFVEVLTRRPDYQILPGAYPQGSEDIQQGIMGRISSWIFGGNKRRSDGGN